MSELKPCKHLNYDEADYGPGIEIRTLAPHYPHVRYWHRDTRWTDNGPGQTPNPAKVQFCSKNKMRINGIFQCYNPLELCCYEPQEN